jgi:Lrp/AsnC family transcriptional regulator for asnA, asnC and gidA
MLDIGKRWSQAVAIRKGEPMRVGQEPAGPVELDDVDRLIVRLLQDDGRRSNADMARVVGTSEQTVRNRIDKLVGNGVIDVMAILNPRAVGYAKDAIICLRVKQGHLVEVSDKLAMMDCVAYVGLLTGSFDIMIEAMLRDDEHLLQFITEELQQLEGIESSETWTVLRTKKFNCAWESAAVRPPGLPAKPGSRRAGNRRKGTSPS